MKHLEKRRRGRMSIIDFEDNQQEDSTYDSGEVKNIDHQEERQNTRMMKRIENVYLHLSSIPATENRPFELFIDGQNVFKSTKSLPQDDVTVLETKVPQDKIENNKCIIEIHIKIPKKGVNHKQNFDLREDGNHIKIALNYLSVNRIVMVIKQQHHGDFKESQYKEPAGTIPKTELEQIAQKEMERRALQKRIIKKKVEKSSKQDSKKLNEHEELMEEQERKKQDKIREMLIIEENKLKKLLEQRDREENTALKGKKESPAEWRKRYFRDEAIRKQREIVDNLRKNVKDLKQKKINVNTKDIEHNNLEEEIEKLALKQVEIDEEKERIAKLEQAAKEESERLKQIELERQKRLEEEKEELKQKQLQAEEERKKKEAERIQKQERLRKIQLQQEMEEEKLRQEEIERLAKLEEAQIEQEMKRQLQEQEMLHRQIQKADEILKQDDKKEERQRKIERLNKIQREKEMNNSLNEEVECFQEEISLEPNVGRSFTIIKLEEEALDEEIRKAEERLHEEQRKLSMIRKIIKVHKNDSLAPVKMDKLKIEDEKIEEKQNIEKTSDDKGIQNTSEKKEICFYLTNIDATQDYPFELKYEGKTIFKTVEPISEQDVVIHKFLVPIPRITPHKIIIQIVMGTKGVNHTQIFNITAHGRFIKIGMDSINKIIAIKQQHTSRFPKINQKGHDEKGVNKMFFHMIGLKADSKKHFQIFVNGQLVFSTEKSMTETQTSCCTVNFPKQVQFIETKIVAPCVNNHESIHELDLIEKGVHVKLAVINGRVELTQHKEKPILLKKTRKIVKLKSSDDEITQIEKFAKLKDRGLITEEEFQAKKKKILGI